MTPENLIHLGRVLEETPERFESELKKLGESSNEAISSDFTSYVYMPARLGHDVGGMSNDGAHEDAGYLLSCAGAGRIVYKLRKQYERDGKTLAHAWAYRCERSTPTTCPVVQANTCLRLLARNLPSQAAIVLFRTNPWIVKVATQRLHELLLEFPVLMHPAFRYDWAAAPTRRQVRAPMMQALTLAAQGSLPTLAAVSDAKLKKWCLHPAVTAAVTAPAPTPVSGAGSGPGIDGLTFARFLANKATRPAQSVFISVLKLDRLRTTAAKRGAPRLPSFLASRDKSNAAKYEEFLTRHLGDYLSRSWNRKETLHKVEGDNQDAAPERKVNLPVTVYELANAASFKTADFGAAMASSLSTFSALVHRQTTADGSPVWSKAMLGEVFARLDQAQHELVAVKAFESQERAVDALARAVFAPITTSPDVDPADFDEYEETIAGMPSDFAQDLVTGFGLRGVQPAVIAAMCESLSPGSPLAVAAMAVCTAQTMRSTIESVIAPAAAVASAPSTRRVGV